MYNSLRTIHLLCGVFALPALLMYGVSAVQMAHSKWFNLKPAVSESVLLLSTGQTDGRAIARATKIRGEISSVQNTEAGVSIRIVVPGTVHEVRYNRDTGEAKVKTSLAGFLGMLNRLHHAAGFWHDYVPMKVWAAFVGIVSLATLGLSATGIWMWWIRRQERKWGLALLAANLGFSILVLTMLRMSGL